MTRVPRNDPLWQQLRALMPGPLPAGFPANLVVLFPPVDGDAAAQALLLGVTAPKVSINLSMFTYTDQTLHASVKAASQAAGVDFKAVFDQSEYQRIKEMKALVDDLGSDGRVLVGRSERKQIVHRKIIVRDHLYVFGGSTNWTIRGEALEDNELVIFRSPAVAARYEQVLDANHARLAAAA